MSADIRGRGRTLPFFIAFNVDPDTFDIALANPSAGSIVKKNRPQRHDVLRRYLPYTRGA